LTAASINPTAGHMLGKSGNAHSLLRKHVMRVLYLFTAFDDCMRRLLLAFYRDDLRSSLCFDYSLARERRKSNDFPIERFSEFCAAFCLVRSRGAIHKGKKSHTNVLILREEKAQSKNIRL
jgi:hypothetical protein